MQGLLLHLYDLAQSTRKTQREDFLSRCVGHYLATVPAFASKLVETMVDSNEGGAGEYLERWYLAGDERRSIDVRAQHPIALPGGRATGWIDLLLDLELDGELLRVIIEAKVGRDVPGPSQLDKYVEAMGADLVVALVGSGLDVGLDDVWTVNWDQVWQAARNVAPDLAALLADSGEVSTWETITAQELRSCQHLRSTDDRQVRQVCRALVPWLFSAPGGEVWARLVRQLVRHEDDDMPTWGSGVGFVKKRKLRGTRIKGLTLALVPTPDLRFLRWMVEVLPTRKGLTYLQARRDFRWARVREYPDWYVSELARVPTSAHLSLSDLAHVVDQGRKAVSSLRLGHHLRDFEPDGVDLPDFSHWRPRALAAGIARVDRVELALRHFTKSVLSQVAAEGGSLETSRLKRSAFVFNDESRVRLRYDERLAHLELVDEYDTAGLQTKWGASVRASELNGLCTMLQSSGKDVVRISLEERSWRSIEAVRSLLLHLARDVVGD
jgi:hypothetical protein